VDIPSTRRYSMGDRPPDPPRHSLTVASGRVSRWGMEPICGRGEISSPPSSSTPSRTKINVITGRTATPEGQSNRPRRGPGRIFCIAEAEKEEEKTKTRQYPSPLGRYPHIVQAHASRARWLVEVGFRTACRIVADWAFGLPMNPCPKNKAIWQTLVWKK